MSLPFVKLHGLESKTFTPPPLDSSLNIPQVFEHHAKNSPNHPLFSYEESDGSIVVLHYPDVLKAVYKATKLITDVLPPPHSPRRDEESPVVAILAALDTITYYTLTVGIMRAGYRPFPISNRNSDAAVAHLFEKTGVKLVFTSDDAAMRGLNEKAAARLGETAPRIVSSPQFKDLYNDESDIPPSALPTVDFITADYTCVILHSSGTTNFPKPITLTHRFMTNLGLSPYYASTDLCGHVLSLHGLPMFHLMGVAQYGWPLFTGMSLSVFKPSNPPALPTGDALLHGCLVTHTTILFVPPLFLEMWSQDSARIEELKTFHTIIFAGGPLQQSIGDLLVAKGINLTTIYGLTETGPGATLVPDQRFSASWAYCRTSKHCDAVFKPIEDMDNVYKIYYKKCPGHVPAVLNAEIDGVPALDTNDLAILHPTDPTLFRIFGRHDEQLIHSTGEKTNPVPIEGTLVQHSKIASAMMFGHGKFHPGVIVTPTPSEAFDPSDEEKLAAFRNAIWPSVERANAAAPSHSRIFKEMIIVADPKKPFEFTPKGTPRRSVSLKLYALEIEKAYEAFEESSQTHLSAPTKWNEESSLAFARRVVQDVLKNPVGDDDDLFQRGCDSLQATWIRNTVIRSLRENSSISTRSIPLGFVYDHPTIRRLAQYFLKLENGLTVNDESQMVKMRALLGKYTENFPRNLASTVDRPAEEVVLLTGSTGVLGSHLLSHLLQSGISKVYVLNRKNDVPSKDRQEASFQEQGLPLGLLRNDEVVFLESDITQINLGLDEELYARLSKEVTTIIHNAWRVDFNLSLQSLEPLILGTRRLIDLALASAYSPPPRFLFTSSIAVFQNWETLHEQHHAPESFLSEPAVAVGSGYGESKWVAEAVLHEASSQTSLRPVIVRIGQLTGAPNGPWNTNEWVPSLIKSSQTVRGLPKVQGRTSWIPIDAAAKVLLELRDSVHLYHNLRHPAPIDATCIFDAFSKTLDLPIVAYLEWVSLIEREGLNKSDAKDNPAFKLLSFFKATAEVVGHYDREIFGYPTLDVQNSLQISETLRQLQKTPLTPNDVENWVKNWRRVGWLN